MNVGEKLFKGRNEEKNSLSARGMFVVTLANIS